MAALKAIVSAAAAWLAAADTQGAGDMLDVALPDVDFFMEAAEDPLKDFEGQAELLKQQVAQHEQEQQNAIVKLKASFEQNLTAQSHACDQIKGVSAELSETIAKEERAIDNLRQDAIKVQKSNNLMRTALDSLRPKMRLAAKFLDDSLANTDDTNATELEVLRPTTPEPSLEHFLGTMGEHGRVLSLFGLDTKPSAKVTLSSKRPTAPEATPEELVGTLAQRVVDLAKAGDQGEAQLRARFLAHYELGEKKRAELLAHQQALQQDSTEKQKLRIQLVAVKTHLLKIKAELSERVNGVRLFAMKGDAEATEALDRAKTAFKASSP